MCVNISSIKRIFSNQSHYFPDIPCIIQSTTRTRSSNPCAYTTTSHLPIQPFMYLRTYPPAHLSFHRSMFFPGGSLTAESSTETPSSARPYPTDELYSQLTSRICYGFPRQKGLWSRRVAYIVGWEPCLMAAGEISRASSALFTIRQKSQRRSQRSYGRVQRRTGY